MKYSINWIQKHIASPLPEVQEVEQKIIFHAFEVEEIERVGNDTVMEIKVLPDRAGDALSHYGMAREIAGLFELPMNPLLKTTVTHETIVPVRIETVLCNRYAAIRIDGVNSSQSPQWLKSSLESIGQKTINTVVDATNYILNDLGQPTHAFDADKIVGAITVRMAREGETVLTLSDEEKVLKETDMVIADDEGVLAIAGVKGGKRAEVTSETKNIILEIAHFDAVAVRKTSRRLGLVTDASKRFENNLSSVMVPVVAARLAALVQELSGGVVAAATDQYQNQQPERTISFTVLDITRILGDSFTQENITTVFDRYGYEYAWDNGVCTFTVPYWRQDITGAHDIAEEVGRVMGYDSIGTLPLPFAPVLEVNDVDVKIQSIKKYFVSNGFSEVMTYSFHKKGDVYVAHAPKDKSALRTNLADALKESYEKNRLNAPLLGLTEVQVFEVGTVFTLEGDEIKETVTVGIATKKGVEEYTLDECIERYSINTADTSITTTDVVQPFKEWSPYPFMVRDIAVWLPANDSALQDTLQEAMQSFIIPEVVVPAQLFDSFSKEGKTSYAYRIVFQASDRTLTDDEVAVLIAPLLQQVAAIPGAQIR